MQTIHERNEANVQAAIAGRQRLANIRENFWYAPATGAQAPQVPNETAPTEEEITAQVAQMTAQEYAEYRSQVNPAAVGRTEPAQSQMTPDNPRIPNRTRYII